MSSARLPLSGATPWEVGGCEDTRSEALELLLDSSQHPFLRWGYKLSWLQNSHNPETRSRYWALEIFPLLDVALGGKSFRWTWSPLQSRAENSEPSGGFLHQGPAATRSAASGQGCGLTPSRGLLKPAGSQALGAVSKAGLEARSAASEITPGRDGSF